MSKRSLSPQTLPTAKRLHTIKPKRFQPHPATADALYDELILNILSYLSWADLCVVQLINRNWARLALDGELWRKQYLTTFGKPRLRGARGPGHLNSREIKPLPARAQTSDSAPKDWKWMFRISSNWRKGRCSVEKLPWTPRPQSSEICSASLDSFKYHLLLFGNLRIGASSQPSFRPIICATSPTESCSVICRPKDTVLCRIATLAIDQSALATGVCKLLSFLSTGELLCYQLQHNPLSFSQRFHCHLPLRRNHSHPVVQAVHHHPLLVTLFQDFTISLYNLEFDCVNLTQTLSSFTSFPPVSLVLSNPSPNIYKLILAYAIPVHPQHWTAGATELIISGSSMMVDSTPGPSPSDPSPSSAGLSGSQNLTVLSTRTARAIDVPFGWIDERKLRTMREQWSRKVSRVADIQTDGKWVILAPGNQLAGFGRLTPSRSAWTPSYPTPISETDKPGETEMNTFIAPPLHSPTNLQLYRLTLPSHNSISSSPPRLSFVRALHGQTGPVAALALSDGRCVSLSLNGSIWVWDLEAGTGAQVSAPTIESTHSLSLGPDSEPILGSVSFDEKRLIIAQSDNVVIRRFDV